MSNRLISQALSTEGAEGDPEVVEASALSAEEAEAALAVEEAANAVEMTELTVEELDHASNSLESIQTYIEGVLENSERGLSTESAQAVDLSFRAALGDALPSPVSSLESFGADSTRHEATESSLEGVGETLKKIGNSIIDAIKKAIKAIGDFFKNLFSGVKKTKKNMEELTKSLEKKKSDGATTEEKELEVVSGKALANVKGEIDLKAGCQELKDFYDNSVEALLADTEAFGAALTNTLKAMGPTYSDLAKAATDEDGKKALKELSKTIDDNIKDFKGKYQKDADLPKLADLPGQVRAKSVRVEIPNIELSGEQTIVSKEIMVGFTIESADDAKDPNEKIDMPSLDDAIEAAKCSTGLLEEIEKGEDRRNKANEARESIIKSVEDVISSMKDAGEEDEVKALKTGQKVSKKIMKLASKNLMANVQKVDNNAYKFARASMKTLKKVDSAYAA